jgi:hypothetical protein
MCFLVNKGEKESWREKTWRKGVNGAKKGEEQSALRNIRKNRKNMLNEWRKKEKNLEKG